MRITDALTAMFDDAIYYRRGEAGDDELDPDDAAAIASHEAVFAQLEAILVAAGAVTEVFHGPLYFGGGLTCDEAEQVADLARLVHGEHAAQRVLYCHSAADDEPGDMHHGMAEPEPGTSADAPVVPEPVLVVMRDSDSATETAFCDVLWEPKVVHLDNGADDLGDLDTFLEWEDGAKAQVAGLRPDHPARVIVGNWIQTEADRHQHPTLANVAAVDAIIVDVAAELPDDETEMRTALLDIIAGQYDGNTADPRVGKLLFLVAAEWHARATDAQADLPDLEHTGAIADRYHEQGDSRAAAVLEDIGSLIDGHQRTIAIHTALTNTRLEGNQHG